MKPPKTSELLRKRAMDALLEGLNDADYATRQHHSDPSFTTQTGKDYAGRGGTEFEPGVSVVIPPKDIRASSAQDPVGGEIAGHEFFKESEPRIKEGHDWSNKAPMSPPEAEAQAHEFVKQAPKTASKPSCPHCGASDYGLMPTDFETAKCNKCGKTWDHGIVPGINDPNEKAAARRKARLYEPIPYENLASTQTILNFMKWEDEGKDIKLDTQPAWLRECIKWLRDHPEDREWRKQDIQYFYGHTPEEYIAYYEAELKQYRRAQKKQPKISRAMNVAAVVNAPKFAAKNAPDPGKDYDFEHEAHIREEARTWAQYAEEEDNTGDIKPFDPAGKYFCGSCDMRREGDQCMRVEGPISFEKGSCRLFHLGEPETDPPMEKKFTKEEAKYGENAEGFSCARCEYGSHAGKPDPDSRPSWCSFWGMHIRLEACCAEWDKGEGKTAANFVPLAALQSKQLLYHATHTSKVQGILEQGIKPLQTSNWVRGEGGPRYGGGEIYVFDDPTDAVRWAGKMDWEFNKAMGSGKVSIVIFNRGDEKWEIDDNDPSSQLGSKGRQLKAVSMVKPEQIVKAVPVTVDMTRAVVQGKPVKLGAAPQDFERLHEKWKDFYYRVHGRPYTEESIRRDLAELLKYMQRLKEFIDQAPESGLFGDEFPTFGSAKPNLAAMLRPVGDVEKQLADERTRKDFFGDIIWGFQTAMTYLQAAFHNVGVEYGHMRRERTAPPDKLGATKAYGMGVPATTEAYGTGTPVAEEEPEPEEESATAPVAVDVRASMKYAAEAVAVDFCSMVAASYKVASGDSVGWFEKSARPTEQKMQLLQRQFGLKPEQIELAIQADPSPNQSDYVAWIAKWMSKGQIRLPEDAGKIKDQLTRFNKLKKSPQFQHSKDIQQYDPGKLFEVLEQSGGAVSKKEQNREAIERGSSIVVQEGDLVIYKVTDPTALSLLSGGTNWCTAQTSMGEHYLKQGASFVFFEGGSAFAQFHPASNQLMNRQDVCMLERVTEESRKRGPWGRRKYDTIASFITDPTALRGMQLLAAKEPEVKKWVEKNVTDQDGLVKILGEKAQQEQRGDSDWRGYYRPEPRREMTVRHALATGVALSAEEEAKLADRVDLDLLLKYGAKFHAGQRWEPLEKSILAQKGASKEIVSYSTKFLKARWPEGEARLLKGALLGTGRFGDVPYNMALAMEYAMRVIKARWPELEAKFHRANPGLAAGWGSAKYAIDILKRRWAGLAKPRRDGKINEEEIIIIGSPAMAREYAEQFMSGQRWAEFEQTAMAAGHLGALIDYTAQIIKGRNPELEQAILAGRKDKSYDDADYGSPRSLALAYAEKVLKTRWPEYEQKIIGHMKTAEPKGHSQEYTPSTKQNWGGNNRLPKPIRDYLEQMVGGRWPEFEQALLQRYADLPAAWVENQNFLDGYLVSLNSMCQKRYKDDAREEEEPDERPVLEQINEPRRQPDPRAQKPFTKFRNDAHCAWPEGLQRLVARDPGYEAVLLDALRQRSQDGDWMRQNESKYVSPEDLKKMEKAPDDAPYEYKQSQPDHTVWNGIWIGWYGMEGVEKYVDYMLTNGQTWLEGVEIMELHEDLEDVRGRYRFSERPNRRQQELQFQSSLLKGASLGVLAADYRPMFQQVLAAKPDLGKEIDSEISWAKQHLRKADRVTWYLRWVRLYLEKKWAGGKAAQMKALLDRDIAAYSKKNHFALGDIPINLGDLKQQLEHWMSLTDKAIQEKAFAFETPAQLQGALAKIEQEIAEQQKESERRIVHQRDEWVWLKRAACDMEAEAMGHCGNSPRASSADTILSLRQPVVKVGRTLWSPHLTFIMDKNYVLGEMKGRNNAKPVPKYHPYIIALLKDQRIRGIKGGGYLPEKNFKIGDLRPEQKAEIERANPQIFKAPDNVEEMAEAMGLEAAAYRQEAGLFVVREWRSTQAMVDDIGNGEAQTAMGYALVAEGDTAIDPDLPGEQAIAGQLARHLSERAKLAIAAELQKNDERLLAGMGADYYTSDLAFYSLMLNVGQNAPESATWRRVLEAYAQGWEATYRGYRAGDLEYLIDTEVYEMGGTTIYTEFRFGPDFSSTMALKAKPCWEAITYDNARRLLEDDGTDHDISNGQLDLYLSEAQYDDIDENTESYDLVNEWYTEGFPKEKDQRQMQLQFQSSLLRRADVDIKETPSFLPPRDDMRRHIDQEAQAQVDEGIMDGVKEPGGAQQRPRPKARPQQIDPRLNPNGQSGWVGADLLKAAGESQEGELTKAQAEQMRTKANELRSQAGRIRPGTKRQQLIVEADRLDAQANAGEEKYMNRILGRPWNRMAGLTEDARGRLTALGNNIVEEQTIGDYDFFVAYDRNFGVHQIGMQRTGQDASDIGQQFEKRPQNRGKGSMQELKALVGSWLKKYHVLVIGSMNPEKTAKYTRLPEAMGFAPQRKNVLGMPFAFINDGTVKLGASELRRIASSLGDDPDFALEQKEEQFLDNVQESQDEAREAFGQDAYLLQEAQERGLSMDDLWGEVGGEWAAEYHGTPFKRQPKIGPEPGRLPGAEALSTEQPEAGRTAGLVCPKCKKANARMAHLLSAGEPPLGECPKCGSFFLIQS